MLEVSEKSSAFLIPPCDAVVVRGNQTILFTGTMSQDTKSLLATSAAYYGTQKRCGVKEADPLSSNNKQNQQCFSSLSRLAQVVSMNVLQMAAIFFFGATLISLDTTCFMNGARLWTFVFCVNVSIFCLPGMSRSSCASLSLDRSAVIAVD